MIEVLSKTRCIDCDICLRVCPTNVFDPGEPGAGAPTIARQADCQTCFQCEAYCPTAAIFVAPLRVPAASDSPFKDEAALLASGQLGIYRARVGWQKDAVTEVPSEDDFSMLMHEVRSRLP